MTLPVLECLLPQQWQWQLPDTTLFLLVLLPLLLTLVLGTIRSFYTKGRHLHLPPGPRKLPVVGNLHQILGSLPHRSLRDLARRHGPVMLLRLGTVPTVVVSSAAAAREVMKTHDGDCCSRPDTPGPRRLSYGLKDVAFAPYDEYWREMRKLFIVELLSMRRVKAAWHARERQVDKLVADLTRLAAAEQRVALDEHIFGLADGIVGTVAFGNVYGTERFAHSRERRFQQVLDDAMDMMASFSAEDFFPGAAGRLADRLTGVAARRERVFAELDGFFEAVIDQHTDTEKGGGGDLVDVLVGLMKQDQQQQRRRFTREHVKGIIMDTFIGGIDTSSVTMLWAMAELIRKPRVLKKAQDEVRASVVGDKERVHPDDMANLRYLKMVVKETLRLHPPATLLLPRETMRAVRIGGYDVPAKTRILVNAWAIGRDPASWGPNAEEFNPDRFEGSGVDVDYNGGHFERICPGLAMGETNVMFTLANLLYCFDWALPEGVAPEDVSMEEAGGLTFHRKTPLLLVPTRWYNHWQVLYVSVRPIKQARARKIDVYVAQSKCMRPFFQKKKYACVLVSFVSSRCVSSSPSQS